MKPECDHAWYLFIPGGLSHAWAAHLCDLKVTYQPLEIKQIMLLNKDTGLCMPVRKLVYTSCEVEYEDEFPSLYRKGLMHEFWMKSPIDCHDKSTHAVPLDSIRVESPKEIVALNQRFNAASPLFRFSMPPKTAKVPLRFYMSPRDP